MTSSDPVGWRLVRVTLATVLIVSVGSRLARGADEEATARALFAEGRRLAAAGDYAAACPKFEGSYRLEPGIGNNFNLADCLEHLGRIASAWARFMDVAAATRAAGQTEREKVARARAATLEPKLARLIIEVNGPSGALTVKRDGTVLGEASWGVAVPVDPGRHAVEASAPDRLSWSSTVEVPNAPGEIRVEVPALADAPAVPSTPVAPPVIVETAPPASRRASPLVIGLAALGAAGLTVGTVFGIKFLSANDQYERICLTTPTMCSESMVDRSHELRSEAIDDRTYELVGFGAAAAALATAAYLWWRSPAPAGVGARSLAQPWFSQTARGFTLSSQF